MGLEVPLDVSERDGLRDREAKAAVSRLIAEIGFALVDTGSLAQGGRCQQPGSDIYNRPMTATEARKILTTA